MKIYYSRLLLIALMCSTSVSQAMDSDEYNKRDSSLPQAKRSNQYTKKDTDKAEYPYSSREDKIENLQRYAIALAQEEEGLHPLANHNYHLAFENPAEGACYKIQNVKLNNGSKWEENVFNQGDTNTCASHAVVDILRYVHKRENIDPFYLHREAHKYFRTNEGGHSIANLMNFVQAYGVPERLPEATKTTKYAFEHFHNVYEIVKGKTKTEQIKNALLEYKHPIVISVISKVISKEGDNDLLKKNTTPIPEYLLADSLNKELVSEEKSIKKSAHAVVVYGYSDNDEGFLIKNSWGIDYVSEGKAILKYEYLNTYSNGNAYVGVGAKKFQIPIQLPQEKNEVVLIMSVNSKKALDVRGTGLLNKWVGQEKPHFSNHKHYSHQLWEIKKVDNKHYIIMSKRFPNRALDCSEGDNKLVATEPLHKSNHRHYSHQLWKLKEADGGWVIYSAFSKRALDSYKKDGRTVIKYPQHSSNHTDYKRQVWIIQPQS